MGGLRPRGAVWSLRDYEDRTGLAGNDTDRIRAIDPRRRRKGGRPENQVARAADVPWDCSTSILVTTRAEFSANAVRE